MTDHKDFVDLTRFHEIDEDGHTIEDSVVVLGGGGIFGVAWMTGVVMGLAEHGIDLTQARAFVGTSAGSIVSAQIAHGYSPAELFARQIDPTRQPGERRPEMNGFAQLVALMSRQWENPETRTRAIAELAVSAKTIDVAQRHADLVECLGVSSTAWPVRSLSITAVDTANCGLSVFTAQSGVELIDAVAASCALAGVWPPAPINGRRYMDGGLWRNSDNAHLARGERFVLIVSPFGALMPPGAHGLQADIMELQESGSRVALVAADGQAHASLGPLGPLDPSIRGAAAQAGRAQGRREIEKIRDWLG